jgi:hypothetical protein
MCEKNWRSSSETVMIEWRGDVYIGHIRKVAPEYSEEIVFLAKSFNPVPRFEDMIRKSKNVVSLYADDSLELAGRYHLLRRHGNELTYLTIEQRIYMSRYMSRIYELMVDDEVLGFRF